MATYNNHRRKELKAIVDEIKKDKPCYDCRIPYHPMVMEYDHRPGEEKLETVSRMVLSGYGIRAILDEIAKCDLVCANCHRLRTISRLTITLP